MGRSRGHRRTQFPHAVTQGTLVNLQHRLGVILQSDCVGGQLAKSMHGKSIDGNALHARQQNRRRFEVTIPAAALDIRVHQQTAGWAIGDKGDRRWSTFLFLQELQCCMFSGRQNREHGIYGTLHELLYHPVKRSVFLAAQTVNTIPKSPRKQFQRQGVLGLHLQRAMGPEHR